MSGPITRSRGRSLQAQAERSSLGPPRQCKETDSVFCCPSPDSEESVDQDDSEYEATGTGRTIVEIERKIKLVTEQNVIDKPSPVAEFPMREWSIKLFMVDDAGNEHPAECFNKVVYNLHPSFDNPVQTFTKPPYACKNEGWGEFELTIDCYYTEKSKVTVAHDLNFQQNVYDVVRPVSFKNPSQALQEKLRELGPLPTDDDRPKKKGIASKKSSSQKYDYEKIADAMEKLEEDDLLKVIQIINDYKSADTYIKSDIDVDDLTEAGEFSIDLYTMPEILTKTLWDHLSKKGLVN